MKNLFLLLFLLYNTLILSQGTTFWDTQLQLTSGYLDKNPTFGTKLISNYSSEPFEFLAFERWNFSTYSNICILKMGENGPVDTVTHITNNNNINKNPSITYNFGILNKAVIVWESYTNSKWNIYARTYNNGLWSTEYPIDTTMGDKHNPCVILIDSTSSSFLFGITYEKNNDIIFKRYNALTNTLIYEINLTSTDTAICKNPKVTKDYGSDNHYYISYERQKSNGQYAIYYRKSNTIPYNWSTPDTLAYLGNNRNLNIISSFPISESFCFESDRSGKWSLYQTFWDFYYQRFSQSVIVSSNSSENRNLVSFLYPVISRGSAQLASYVRQDIDSIRIVSGSQIPVSIQNTFSIGDSSKKPVLAMNSGIPTNNSLFRVWLVFNKDSAGYSKLYTFGKKLAIAGNIKKISDIIPESISLLQNFPNPFNPTTNIRFNLSENSFVNLSIYNILGKKIEVLVNKKMDAGSYILDWKTIDFPSGVYFCKLTVDNKLFFTKKMVLIK